MVLPVTSCVSCKPNVDAEIRVSNTTPSTMSSHGEGSLETRLYVTCWERSGEVVW